MQDKPLEEKKILEMFYQIVAAIHYIHEHKILHRDLKTVNIFLTKEEIIKIGDFGISKMLSTTHDGANSVIGTPYYISPEMVNFFSFINITKFFLILQKLFFVFYCNVLTKVK